MHVLSDYLVAVGRVLGRPGGDGDGVWLAAGVAQTVCVFTGFSESDSDLM